MFNDNSHIKNEIKCVNPELLVNRGYAQAADKSGIVCPHCGNGTHGNGTGVIPHQNANGEWVNFCHRCGKPFDNLDLIASHFGYDLRQDFPKVLAEGATLLGASAGFGDFRHNHNAKKNFTDNKNTQDKQNKNEKPPVDHSKFLQVAKNNLINFPFATYRGFSAKTLTHFNFGFGVNWRHPDIKNAPPSDRLIIPTSNFHYLARAIDDSVPEQYRKQHVGHKEIFNAVDLQLYRTVLVVEGELDCASVWQATDGLVPCIAVSGCANYKLLLNWLKAHPEIQLQFIVVFDNDSKGDNAGQTNAKKFVAELNKLGYPAVNRLLSDRKDFDANDWLQEDQNALCYRLFDIYDDATSELELVVKQIEVEKEMQEKISEFETVNGKIPDGVVEEIKAAVKLLQSLTPETFDGNLLNSSAFLRQLGLCKFYYFAAPALDNFSEVVRFVKDTVSRKIKSSMKLTDNEKPLQIFELSDIKRLIKKSAKAVEGQHIAFNKEQKRKEREEYKQRQKAEEKQAANEARTRLLYLHSLPQNDERDFEIRQLILELCEWQKDRHGNKLYVKPSNDNYYLIFSFEPLLQGLFAYNAFSGTTVFRKNPSWNTAYSNSRIDEILKKDDYEILFNKISRTYKIEGFRKCCRHVTEFAHKNTFHPIKEYFKNLPAWDGTPRLETIFCKYLGIEDSPYSREVTKKFFIAAVARAYFPGCEWQYMPLFQGNQGIGKGKLIKMLVDKVIPYGYVELSTKLNDSHAVDILRLAWFAEMPELCSMKGVPVAAINAFVAARNDTNRFAYEKDPEQAKRHCVVFGSVNEKFPLKDKNGNRRFLVLKSNLEENQYVPGLTDEEITQFWAEVYFYFKEICKGGFHESKLLLSKDSIITAAQIAKSYVEDDGLAGEILGFVDMPIVYQPVWRLMSMAERRKFFENGGSIILNVQDLRSKQFARRRPDEMAELDKILNPSPDDLSIRDNNDGTFTFYGAELRQTICASEIFNEHLKTYDRKIIPRVAEILATELPKLGWHRQRHKIPVYGNQINCYCRDVAEETEQVTQPDTAPQEQTTSPENVTNNTQQTEPQNSSQPADATQTPETNDTDNKTAENVTLVSSSVHCDDEEFLTADDFRDIHDLE